MANVTQVWGTGGNFTHTGYANLASSATAGRQTAELDVAGLGANLEDLQVTFRCKIIVGSVANDKAVYCYLAGSIDGTNYPQGNGNAFGATEAAVTFTDIPIVPCAVISTSANIASTDKYYETQPISAAQVFGGTLPKRLVAAVRNYSGLAFSSNDADFVVRYIPIYRTVT